MKDYNRVFELIDRKLKEEHADGLIDLLKCNSRPSDEVKKETDILRIEIRKKLLRQGTDVKKIARESGKKGAEAKVIKNMYVEKKTSEVKALLYNVILYTLKEINNKF